MYKDILVQLDSGERAAERLRLAIGLAQRFGARLTGLFAQLERDAASVVARRGSENYQKAAADAEAAFKAATADAGLVTEWRKLPFGEHNFVIREMVICARYADLTIVGQYDPERGRYLVPDDLNEQLILECGGPVLIVPYAGNFATAGQRVQIAWNGSREAARAVRDAMPFLTTASEVRVLAMHSRDQAIDDQDLPRVNIVDRLAAQGVTARYEVIKPEGIGVMDLILSRSADEGSDMIVMGAHGDYGFPYLHRGSGTRHILRHMTVPVLLTH
jgi:nucleotide-binding universal stress UspA family protein